jgi:D-alanyl-lipoteichoic acid acyltransferase DltB (MBOAT superfamily)
MLFNSVEFLLFFLIVFGLYFAIPSRRRWILLLVASYVFYMAWSPTYVVLLVISTLTAYLTGFGISRSSSLAARRACLTLSVAINLLLLLTFKYLDFFIQVTMDAAGLTGWDLELPFAKLLLPVGISFYTFQTLSYSFDVYRGTTQVEPHLGRFALFVNFFPQLVAGPIERSGHLLPQFRRETHFNYERIRDGFLLTLWGIYKKVCIADLVAPSVAAIFASPADYNGTLLLIGALLFCVQIYCDFSGYSDIAIGLARMLGYDLLVNFRQPFLSTSISEFWRRWHISLGTWFRDYIYIPMGGNRVSQRLLMRNTMIVFFLSGLWHGNAWTFVLFGVLHGAWIVVEMQTFNRLASSAFGSNWLERPIIVFGRWLLTQLVVLIGFTLFVSRSLDDFWYVITHFLDFGAVSYLDIATLGLPNFNIVLVVLNIGILVASDLLLRFHPTRMQALAAKSTIRLLFALGMGFSIAMFGVFKRIDFIYFQF